MTSSWWCETQCRIIAISLLRATKILQNETYRYSLFIQNLVFVNVSINTILLNLEIWEQGWHSSQTIWHQVKMTASCNRQILQVATTGNGHYKGPSLEYGDPDRLPWEPKHVYRPSPDAFSYCLSSLWTSGILAMAQFPQSLHPTTPSSVIAQHQSHSYDDVMTWKHIPHYWPFVRGYTACVPHIYGK